MFNSTFCGLFVQCVGNPVRVGGVLPWGSPWVVSVA